MLFLAPDLVKRKRQRIASHPKWNSISQNLQMSYDTRKFLHFSSSHLLVGTLLKHCCCIYVFNLNRPLKVYLYIQWNYLNMHCANVLTDIWLPLLYPCLILDSRVRIFIVCWQLRVYNLDLLFFLEIYTFVSLLLKYEI